MRNYFYNIIVITILYYIIIVTVIIILVVNVSVADLIEVLLKLRCIIIDVINIDCDVSSGCVPTIKHLQ